jgi:class 3 adenylate cyclase/tetratricopeptide (TPR) repeat protein
MVSSYLETLASYVPQLIARRFAAQPAPLTAPVVDRFPAAILFADITGFTALTERLAQRGPVGAEQVSALLNDYFGQLIDLVYAHGGDVVKFAGDALLALWPEAPLLHLPPQAGGGREGGLRLAAHRAAQCALIIQKTLHNYEPIADVRLSLRVSIGAGEVFTVYVGGVNDRWEFIVAGEPLVQLRSVKQQAQPGDALISPQAWALIQDVCLGHPLESGDVLLGAVRAPPPLEPGEPIALPAAAEAALRAYIPVAALDRLAAGQTGWLAELRRVTVVFLNMPDLNYGISLERAQDVMRAMQTTLYRYEGSINKLSVDDQGVSLVAALGLPPLAHEDDPARGVQAALAMQALARDMGFRSTIGVTTGQVFCGSVGNATRREYTMVGDTVNLSTRLMQNAPENRMLCDEATVLAAQARLAFDPLPAISVKGKAGPVTVYGPRPPSPAADRASTTPEAAGRSPQAKIEMVGRETERAIVVQRLRALRDDGAGGVIVIEGEAGIGKSRLVEFAVEQAQALGVTTLIGAGDPIERSTPYHAWRGVLGQLLDLESLTLPSARRARVLARLQADPNWLRLAPLLNSVLSLDLHDNDLTEQMTGQVRADNLRHLLMGLLATLPRREPKVLVMEDAHWLDSASWALLLRAGNAIPSILFVIAIRPPSDPLPPEISQLLQLPGLQLLQLEPLPADDALELVCARLGVSALPEAVRALILEKAEGHPFFSEELAYALRDTGLIEVRDGECRIAPHANDLRALYLPDTVQGVITSRIDRLTPPQQLTLKVASVIGRVFAYRTLAHIHPVEADRPNLQVYLHTLEQLDITPLDTPEPDLAYIFKHIITREVAYNLMLFAQRRQLHRAVAEWYERNYPEDLSPYYPLLAHHWNGADDATRTIDYLEKAGEQALGHYANQEAIRFFSDALRLAGERANGASEMSTFRRARWERQLAEAYFGMGDLTAAREHFQCALKLLGAPAPATRRRTYLNLLGEAGIQAARRLAPRLFARPARGDAERLLEVARANERFAELAFFDSDRPTAIAAAFRMLNAAERAEVSPELARAYANISTACGLVPLHRPAQAYARLARDVAQRVNHLHTLGRVLTRTSVHSLGVGEWAAVEDRVSRAVDIFTRLGDRRQAAESLGLLAAAAFFQGNFARGVELRSSLYEEARGSGNVQHQAWGLRGRAENVLRLGRLDEAIESLETVADMLAGSRDRHGQIQTHGMLAVAYLRRGDAPRAEREAAIAAELIAQSSPTVYSALEGYSGVAEVYLALWENAEPGKRLEMRDSARAACKALRRFARVFPIGRPRLRLWQGVSEWLDGRREKARAAWRESLVAAERLGMVYDQALTHYEIGRRLEATDPVRGEHLARAAGLFERVGAQLDVARAKTERGDH